MPDPATLDTVVKVIAPVVGHMVRVGLTTTYLKPPEDKNLGIAEVTGNKETSSEVHLQRYSGQPQNRAEYRITALTAGGFTWKCYVRNTGAWYERLGGGKVYEGILYIDGPLCPNNSFHSEFMLNKSGMFCSKKWVCRDCGYKVPFVDPDKLNSNLAKQLRKKIIDAFGLNKPN